MNLASLPSAPSPIAKGGPSTSRAHPSGCLHQALERTQAGDDLIVGVVETLVNAMETKDTYLRGHSIRVASLATAIARELGMAPERVALVQIAGRLHDVGKIGTREAVLHKTAPLTPAEVAHIQEHVLIGMEILAPLTQLGDALTFIQQHHERLNGSGYPYGLAGDEISDGARILAVTDAFDSLTSFRPYRPAIQRGEAFSVLLAEGSATLDRTVLSALGKVLGLDASAWELIS